MMFTSPTKFTIPIDRLKGDLNLPPIHLEGEERVAGDNSVLLNCAHEFPPRGFKPYEFCDMDDKLSFSFD